MNESSPRLRRRIQGLLRLPEPTDTYVMNVVFVLVFGGGVTVLTLGLLPPRPAGLLLGAHVTVAVTAAIVAVVVWQWRDRALPAPVIHGLTALGTALITVAVAFGGDASTHLAVFYLWMVVYAAAFFTLPGWVGHLLMAATGYGLAAWIHPDSSTLVEFAPVILGPALVVGGMVYVVTTRMRATAARLLECVQISGELISESPDEHEVLRTICQGSQRACDAASATLATTTPAGGWRIVGHSGRASVTAAQLPGLVAADATPRVPGATTLAPQLTEVDRGGWRDSRLVHPLHDGEELVGALVVDWDTTIARLSDVVAHVMRAYAEQATAALRYHRLHRSLTQLAATDALTGLPNRRGFEAALASYAHGARRRDDTVGLALFDLDGFKLFNDGHGHAAGDELLCQIAVAWRGRLREQDLLARLGGDEFALVAPDTSLDDTVVLAQDLCALVPSDEVTCSAGVVAWNRDESLLGHLDIVDRYLYAAKRDGGGTVRARVPGVASVDPSDDHANDRDRQLDPAGPGVA